MRDQVIRTLAFVRREMVSTLHQPRLLLTLILGPFLVLFVFGLGYQRDFPTLDTVVVGSPDSQLLQRLNDFIADAEVSGIEIIGTRDDRDAALEELKGDTVDLVVVLPPDDQIGTGERATVEVHQRSPDPVTSAQVNVAAETAVAEINDQVVAEVLRTVQDETTGLTDDLRTARDQLDQLRGRIGTDDAATIQSSAATLAEQLTTLADRIEQGGGLAAAFGLEQPGQVQQDLRDAADQLSALSESDPLAQVDEVADMLATADESLTLLQDTDADVLARPFQAEVYSFTPAVITLDLFYAPGLLALMLQHVAITFAALGLVRERRQGTTDVLRVSPVGTGQRLAGTAASHMVLGLVVAAALTALIIGVFGVPAPTNWVAFSGLVTLTLLASVGYGFLIAGVAKTDSQAVQLSMLMLLTAIFFSGLFLPLARITAPVVWVSWALPTTHAFVGMQELMLLGDSNVSPLIWVGLSLIAVVSLVAARLLLPWRDRHA